MTRTRVVRFATASSMNRAFERFSDWVNRVIGAPVAFATALSFILAWALTGPIFHFSDTWQLVINTSTTIVTFLLGFAISNQNKRSAAQADAAMDALARLEQQHGGELHSLRRINQQQMVLLVLAVALLLWRRTR